MQTDCRHLNAYKLSVCPDCGTNLYPPSEITHRCSPDSECFCMYDPECNPAVTPLVVFNPNDPAFMLDAECAFNTMLKDFQEPNGAYACDDHIILGMAVRALRAASESSPALKAGRDTVQLPNVDDL